MVYGEGLIRIASPLGTRIIAENFYDENAISCELSDEELLKIVGSMQ
ncbi:MAG: hypothetical protein R3251_04435 [Candidatus Spechtbacterales bacterium]|nr:hypothetical protein [Candidatus Spechtbacterales bacterium]